jgi:DNA repair protein RadC
LPIISSDSSRATLGALAPRCCLTPAASLPNENYTTAYFPVRKRRTPKKTDTSSHHSSVQERLVNYGSEALDTAEHLGLIIGNQQQAAALSKHFESIPQLARASVQGLLPFLSRANALRVVSSLRLAAVALRQEREQLTIDSPAISKGILNESLAHRREIFRRVITYSAHAFILGTIIHPAIRPLPRLICGSPAEFSNLVKSFNSVRSSTPSFGLPAPDRSRYFSFKEAGVSQLSSENRKLFSEIFKMGTML